MVLFTTYHNNYVLYASILCFQYMYISLPLSFTNTAVSGLDIDSSVAPHCSLILTNQPCLSINIPHLTLLRLLLSILASTSALVSSTTSYTRPIYMLHRKNCEHHFLHHWRWNDELCGHPQLYGHYWAALCGWLLGNGDKRLSSWKYFLYLLYFYVIENITFRQ